MVKRNKRQPGVPGYLKHKGSGQAFTIIRDENGNRRQVSLGAYGTPASKRRYREVVAAILRAEPTPEKAPDAPDEQDELTVEEVVAKFLQHAETYYRKPSGEQTNEFSNCVQAVGPLLDLYADELAADFGPRKLKKVREEMVGRGWCRTHANKQTDRVKRCFKWAASEELVPGSIYQDLRTVSGLRRGRSEAIERGPVKPVPLADIKAVMPHLPPTVAAMLEVQYLVGCRPHEVCELRTEDLDRSGDLWLWHVRRHKAEHLDREKTLVVGPKAQRLLQRYLRLDGKPLFQPAQAMAERRAKRRQARKTPLYPSHVRQMKRRRKKNPRKKPGEMYDASSYRQALHEACERAGVGKFSGLRVRHARATEIRRRFGLEAAQAALAHARCDATQVYAESRFDLALRVAREMG